MKANIIRVLLMLMPFGCISAQTENTWTLRNAIDYALENNINVKKNTVARNISEENYTQARASRFPNLTFSAGETFSHFNRSNEAGEYSSDQSFSEQYRLSSSVTLFEGFRIKNSIKAQEIALQNSDLLVEEAKQNIEIAITESYLQILYAKDNVRTAELSLETSKAHLEQGELKYRAGSIAETDYAKLKSQHSNDAYRLVAAQNALANRILDFKQLLELGIEENPTLYYPEIADDEVVELPPSKEEVFENAMGWMPQIKSGQNAILAAEYDLLKAKSGLYPSISMSAGISTGHSSADKERYFDQLNHNFSQNIGLSLNYNIFSHKEVRTNIKKSEFAIETAKLNAQQDEKDLLKTVEEVYLNVISSQNRYLAAKEAFDAAEISYRLMQDKFKVGLTNMYDYIEEKNNYLNAQREFLQAKYETLLNQKLLDFYQHKPINL